MSIDTDSTTINFNGANLKIATSGKGLIFADGTTLSSNTEIGSGGGSSNLHQVMEFGNATSNTMLLENTGRTIVSSGNIESNIITTIIRFQEGSELPDGQGITLDNSANNSDNTFSNSITFTNGLVSGNILVTSTVASEIMLEADSGDTTETNNPVFKLRQDGRGIGADFGIDQYNSPYINFNATGALSSSANSFHINYIDSANTYFTVSKTGNVGIGTPSPSANLHVAGNVHATSDITTDGKLEVGITKTSSYFLSGDPSISTDSYIYTRALLNTPQNGGLPSAIVFGTGSTYGTNQIALITNGVDALNINSSQEVGIGVTSPASRLHIKQESSDQAGDITDYNQAAFVIERNGSSTHKWTFGIDWSNRLRITFNFNQKAVINDDGTDDTFLNFTGQHRCFNQFSNASNLVGLIVCSKSNKYVNFDFSQSPTINECLPVITLSNVAYDKSCFGVISGKEDAGTRTTSSGTVMSFLPQESGDNRVFVNSLGEGAIWVSNLNGNLESGDYITTSNIAGYGQKQDSEFLANYTVAKITMDCDFNPQMVPKRVIKKDADGNNVLDSNGNLILEDSDELIPQYEVKTLEDGTKVAFVGCTYHCG